MEEDNVEGREGEWRGGNVVRDGRGIFPEDFTVSMPISFQLTNWATLLIRYVTLPDESSAWRNRRRDASHVVQLILWLALSLDHHGFLTSGTGGICHLSIHSGTFHFFE